MSENEKRKESFFEYPQEFPSRKSKVSSGAIVDVVETEINPEKPQSIGDEENSYINPPPLGNFIPNLPKT